MHANLELVFGHYALKHHLISGCWVCGMRSLPPHLMYKYNLIVSFNTVLHQLLLLDLIRCLGRGGLQNMPLLSLCGAAHLVDTPQLARVWAARQATKKTSTRP